MTSASPNRLRIKRRDKKNAFSLIEVVLAVGIFSLALIALLGLLGSTQQSVNNVVEQTRGISVMSKVNAYLQSQDFTTVYNWVAGGTTQVVYVYSYRADLSRKRDDDGSPIPIAVFTEDNTPQEGVNFKTVTGIRVLVEDNSFLLDDLEATENTIFKAVISDSLVYPAGEPGRGTGGTLVPFNSYPEAYLALNVKIYAEEIDDIADISVSPSVAGLELILEYNTAINR